MSRTKIVTESTADIPKELIKELDIVMLPIPIVVGDKEYKDNIDIEPKQFYDILEQSEALPSTSQLSPNTYYELYKNLWEEGYTDIIYISINANGSGTYNNSIQARALFYEDYPQAEQEVNIHLIDSATYSMGYGWAVVTAARMAKKNEPVDKILAEVREWLDNVCTTFVPLNLRFVKKSGRVSAAAAFVGDALGLKPVIIFENGESKVINKIRGEKRVASELVKIVKSLRKAGTPYMLAYGNNDEQFEQFKQICQQELEMPPEMEYALGCVITINSGANAIGIIFRK